MLKLELTHEEAAVIERLFNQISGIDNMRAIIPIHDKLIAASKAAGAPLVVAPVAAAQAVRRKMNGKSRAT